MTDEIVNERNAKVIITEYDYVMALDGPGRDAVGVTARWAFPYPEDGDSPRWRVSTHLGTATESVQAAFYDNVEGPTIRVPVDDKGRMTVHCYHDLPHDCADALLHAMVDYRNAERAAAAAVAEVIGGMVAHHDAVGKARYEASQAALRDTVR